jgi:hypothetical protein
MPLTRLAGIYAAVFPQWDREEAIKIAKDFSEFLKGHIGFEME